MPEIKLTSKQKEVVLRLRDGYFLYENQVTPGARWSLGKHENNYRWGSVNGNVIDKIAKNKLISGSRLHTACFIWELTELGKTIPL